MREQGRSIISDFISIDDFISYVLNIDGSGIQKLSSSEEFQDQKISPEASSKSPKRNVLISGQKPLTTKEFSSNLCFRDLDCR